MIQFNVSWLLTIVGLCIPQLVLYHTQGKQRASWEATTSTKLDLVLSSFAKYDTELDKLKDKILRLDLLSAKLEEQLNSLSHGK